MGSISVSSSPTVILDARRRPNIYRSAPFLASYPLFYNVPSTIPRVPEGPISICCRLVARVFHVIKEGVGPIATFRLLSDPGLGHFAHCPPSRSTGPVGCRLPCL